MDNTAIVEDTVEDKVEDQGDDKGEDKIEEPKVGMIFDTGDEVMEYYGKYGDQMGFQIRRRTCRKGDDGECVYLVFACGRQGKPRSTKKTFRVRAFGRTDCKAKLNAAICPDGKWRVTNVTNDHNHPLSPGKLRFRPYGKRKFGIYDKAGTRGNKNALSCVVEGDGHDNTSFLRLGQGDSNAIQSYFMKMQANNCNFFYMMDLDNEGRLRNVFWADARSRKAYEEFGDVVTFDTSYLKNKYELPFASFVGANHHGQLTLLGCALLSGEVTDTFTWLFQSWLACMSGQAPKAIITDQDMAVQKAVENVFPDTRHRWCLWHIMKKLPDKLGGCDHYESVRSALQMVVYDSLTLDEFEDCWTRLIEKYNLQGNEWLLDLYDERHRWAPAFLKGTFWAGMSTTQRSESVSSFFDGFVNSKTSLKQFLEQYENALRSKVEMENHEDINSFNSCAPCITHYAIEKQFRDAYTTTKFKEFQHELTRKMYCELSSVRKEFAHSVFEVIEDWNIGEIGRRITFKVSLTHYDCDVQCNCCLFETRGILCRHAVAVLIHNQIMSVPEKCIIPRWRKDSKRRHRKVKVSYDDWSGKPEAQRYDMMSDAFCEVAEMSTDSDQKVEFVLNRMDGLKKELRREEIMCGTSQPTINMNDETLYFSW